MFQKLVLLHRMLLERQITCILLKGDISVYCYSSLSPVTLETTCKQLKHLSDVLKDRH